MAVTLSLTEAQTEELLDVLDNTAIVENNQICREIYDKLMAKWSK